MYTNISVNMDFQINGDKWDKQWLGARPVYHEELPPSATEIMEAIRKITIIFLPLIIRCISNNSTETQKNWKM